MKSYLDAKVLLKEEMDENEGTDRMEEMLKVRREWINEQKELNLGKIPDDIEKMYLPKEIPLTPEEQAIRDSEDADKAAGKKAKKKEAPKKKAGKKGKGKGGGDGDAGAP